MYSIYKFYMVSSGEGNGNPFQYSCLGNSMDKGAWRATVRGVAKSQTRLSDYTHTHTHTHMVSPEVLQSEIYIWVQIQTQKLMICVTLGKFIYNPRGCFQGVLDHSIAGNSQQMLILLLPFSD